MAFLKDRTAGQVPSSLEEQGSKNSAPTGLLDRLGGFLTAPRSLGATESHEAFFPEWSVRECEGEELERAETELRGGALPGAGLSRFGSPSGALESQSSLEQRLKAAFSHGEWAELEDLLWEVQAKAQLGGKKELALRAQSLAEWAARAANAPGVSAVPPQGESLLEDVILRLNHLCWIEDSVREGFVGA